MGSRSSPEQYELGFPDHLSESDRILFEKIKEKMHREPAYKNLPPNDPVFDEVGTIRLEQVKAGTPSIKHHDHLVDD